MLQVLDFGLLNFSVKEKLVLCLLEICHLLLVGDKLRLLQLRVDDRNVFVILPSQILIGLLVLLLLMAQLLNLSLVHFFLHLLVAELQIEVLLVHFVLLLELPLLICRNQEHLFLIV